MGIMILNGSPKEKGSASNFFAKILKILLGDKDVEIQSIRIKKSYDGIFSKWSDIDTLVIMAPMYVDGMPSHVVEFMEKAEEYLEEHPCSFRLYVVSNHGFIEGKQSEPHLNMYECWCKHTGITWGGGLGIGTGVLVHKISISFFIEFITLAFHCVVARLRGKDSEKLDSTLAISTLAFLVLNSDVIFGLCKLARGIKNKKLVDKFYVRPLIPARLFVYMGDLFMIISALNEGKNLFHLLNEDEE